MMETSQNQSPTSERREICLLGASFETPNMGVSALTAGAIRCFVNRWPDAKVFLFDYGTTTRTYTLQCDGRIASVPLLNMRFSKKFYLRNNIAYLLLLAGTARCLPAALGKRIISGNQWLRKIDQTTLVASIAGGDSFSDIYGLARLLYVALPQLLMILMKKPLVQMPQTLGPFKRRFARWLARYILSHSYVIYSRDEKGLREVSAMLGTAQARAKSRFSYDIGFVLEPAPPRDSGIVGLAEPRPQNSVLVGLNVSGLLYGGKSNHRNTFGFGADYDNLVSSVVDLLLRKDGVSILLTPHVFGDDDESDVVVCRKIYAQLGEKHRGRVGFAAGVYNQSEIKYLIGQCDFFVGSRMHACIGAVSQNIPAVSIAYSDKFIGVMQSVGLESLVADPRTMSQEQILRIVDFAYDHRTLLREQLSHQMPEIKQSILNMFDGQPDAIQSAKAEALERVNVG
jgi:colanic acid/amylovoran biosynthesis protein